MSEIPDRIDEAEVRRKAERAALAEKEAEQVIEEKSRKLKARLAVLEAIERRGVYWPGEE